MKTAILFRDFQGLEHIKSHILENSARSIGKFERAENGLHAEVIVSLCRKKTNHGQPSFECELLVGGPDIRKPIVIKKKDGDFYAALHSCFRSVEKVLRRVSKKRISSKRRASVLQPRVAADQLAS